MWEQLRTPLEAKWEKVTKVTKEDLDEIQFFGGSEGARYRFSYGKTDADLDEGCRRIGKTAMSKDFPHLAGGPTHGMKERMPGLKWKLCVLTLALLSSAACTAPSVRHEEAVPPVSTVPTGAPEDRRVLAGEWDYEDGGVVTLTLDEQGNGTYPWKDGHIITNSLSDHVWRGIWVQKENDREGGFSLDFSQDFSDGDGRWWYTRIEDDRAPAQKGGTFHLSKNPSRSASSEISSAP